MANNPTSVIDLFTTPPIGTLAPVLDENGPFGFGDHTLTTFHTSTFHGLLPPGDHGLGGTYGVIVQVSGAIPISWGYEIGYDSGGAIGAEGWIYEQRFAQLLVLHQTLSGPFVPIIQVDCKSLQTFIPMPLLLFGGDAVGLHVTPSVSVDLYFMCLLA